MGCGVISRAYVENASAFPSFDIVACADLDQALAGALAKAGGLAAVGVDELIADPSIDVVLNLTPPLAHAAVTAQALAAGKHVYSEKPLAIDEGEALALAAEADRLGLRLGCAPDIFLGSAYQAGRAAIDRGAIGEPLAVSAAMLAGGQETWHPNPDIFYAAGAGPLLDMGPYYLTAIVALLGPIERVAGFASTRTLERTIAFGPRLGERFRATTPTHTTSAMQLARGVTANLVASFEAGDQYICDIAIHGSEGVLRLPDPNAFGGPVRCKRGGGWEDAALRPARRRRCPGHRRSRHGRGDHGGTPHRASGRLALHVIDVARSILAAAESGTTLQVGSTVDRPSPLPVEKTAAPRRAASSR